MPDLLIAFVLGAAVLGVFYLVLRWAAWAEARAHERKMVQERMKRVYWVTRADVPVYRRRWAESDEPEA